MSATIDGSSWSTVTRASKHFASTNMFTITGTSMSGEVLVITIRGDEEGSYSSSTSIDSASAQVGAVFQPDATSPAEDNFVSKSGSVTISKIDSENNRISGSFSFSLTKLSEAKSVTNGEFTDLKYSDGSD